YDKNKKLKAERDICFEQVVMYIERGGLLDIVSHPNQSKYLNQHILVVEMNNYVYLVPFVEDENSKFLKTIIPSRKATKDYLGGSNNDK
ncbi:MAG: toxin, partial [Desulfamplus sp.]|nr:toxin [Desulfamplus sp.]